MWNILDKFAENVRVYSTPVGQLWNTVTFVFRMFVIVAVGSAVYGDEQGAFKCDTGQPGCQNVCFNRFSPISHMRFWAFQILFVATPPLFFYLYAGVQTGKVKQLEEEKKKLKKNQEELDSARGKLIEANNADDDDGRKSTAAFSTFDDKVNDLNATEKRINKLKKQVGRYKEKEVIEMAKGGSQQKIIFTTNIRIFYIVHCLLKLAVEVVFLYLGYLLQHQQSKAWGWAAWTVPEKYTCTHALEFGAAGSACAQQEKVTCWVSRPWEKRIFLYYMLFMTCLSVLLIFAEALYMIFRVSNRGIQRRANEHNQKMMNQTQFAFENGSVMGGFAGGADTMMSMRSQRGVKSGLAAANSWRYAQQSRHSTMKQNSFNQNGLPPYPEYQRYGYGMMPQMDDFLPDDGVPLMPHRRALSKKASVPNGVEKIPVHVEETPITSGESQTTATTPDKQELPK